MMTILFGLLAGCGANNAAPPTPTPAPEAPPAEAEPAPAAEPTMLVKGTIAAPDDAPVAKAVFVSLRQAGVPGPPLAAKRLPAGPFPLSFVLTEADRPMAKGPVPDEVELKVTLDIDGNPMAKSDEDLEAVVAVEKGTADLEVTLAPR